VDDWTIVRVRGDANKAWGAIPVVAKAIRKDQFVNIIQHPGGGPKQIALYHNTVVFASYAALPHRPAARRAGARSSTCKNTVASAGPLLHQRRRDTGNRLHRNRNAAA